MLKENLVKVLRIVGNNSEGDYDKKAISIEESLKNCIKLKLCTTPESKKIEKMITKLKTDISSAGIKAKTKHITYALLNGDKDNKSVADIHLEIDSNLSGRKISIDQRPHLSRRIDIEHKVLSYSKTKKDAGESQKIIKELQKEKEKLLKSNTYYQSTSEFKTMVRNMVSDVNLKKLPSYIKFDTQRIYMEEQDRYDSSHGGYTLSIKKLNKEKLKEIQTKIKEKKYVSGVLEKYNNEFFLVDTVEHEDGTPKEFQLMSKTTLTIQLDKIPEYKSLLGIGKKLESTNEMSM
jgi:hypothetical protein